MHFSTKLLQVMAALDLDLTIDDLTVTLRNYGEVSVTATFQPSSSLWEITCDNTSTHHEDLNTGLVSLLTLS